jgi:hypothetical protein
MIEGHSCGGDTGMSMGPNAHPKECSQTPLAYDGSGSVTFANIQVGLEPHWASSPGIYDS